MENIQSARANQLDDSDIETCVKNVFELDVFKNSFDCYFILKTKDGKISIPAHKMFLSIWSPKFEDIFYKQEMQDNRVELNDTNPEAFKDMLRYMYCHQPVLDSLEKALEIYKVAAEFEVTSLMNLCKKILHKIDIDVPNVFYIYYVANIMQNQEIMEECVGIIQTKTRSILCHYDCCDVSPSMIEIILQCSQLSLKSEYELLDWVFSWGKNHLLENTKYGCLRDVLNGFLPRMQFLALTNIQFATICKNRKEFFSEKEALSIFMNIALKDSYPKPAWYDTNAKSRIFTG